MVARARGRASRGLATTIVSVSRTYTLAEANALIPEIAVLTERLRALRDEVVGLRDAYRERETEVLEDLVDSGSSASQTGALPSALGDDAGAEPADAELRRLRLRMRGLVDQMQADAAWLDDREIVLRDIASGLLDFPGEAGGQPIWLCWRRGEAAVGFWHRHDQGFGGRRSVAELDLGARA